MASAPVASSPNKAVVPTLRGNAFWTVTGNLGYAACQWGMLMVLAKLGTPSTVGQFTLGLAISAPIILFFNLSLRSVQATDAQNLYSFRDYRAVRIRGMVAAALVVAIVTVAMGYSVTTTAVIAAVTLTKVIESFSDLTYGFFQQHERFDVVARSFLMRGIGALIALTIVFALTKSLFLATIAMALVWLAVLLMHDARGVGSYGGRRNVAAPAGANGPNDRIAQIVRLSIPMAVAASLISLSANVPRYFIEQHSGESALGLFSAMAYIMVVASTVVNALGQATTPRLAGYAASGDLGAFRAILMRLYFGGLLIGLVGIAVATVVGRPLLTVLYTPEYGQYTSTFVMLMVAATFSHLAAFAWYGVTALRKFKVQVPVFVAVVGVQIVACALLIPRFGLVGAALSLVVAYFIQFVSLSTVVLLNSRPQIATATRESLGDIS